MKTDLHFGLSDKKILKSAVLIPALAVSLMFSGCGSGSDVTVTAEQNDLIAEYVAGTLMKYSHQNEWKYIKLNDNITNFERPSESVKPSNPNSGSQGGSGNNTTKPTQGSNTQAPLGTMADLASALKLDGITISYENCVVGKNYPKESDVFSVRATSGRDIAAVEFLNNDLNMLSDVSIAPGENFKAVVLFMVAEGSADEISSLDLMISENGSVISKIPLK